MNTDLLKSAVAAIFRRKGKKFVTEEEFIFAASMELRWFPPAKAALFLKNAKSYGMVASTRDGLTPTFPLDDQGIEQVISPPASVVEETQNPVATIVDIICSKTKQTKSEVMARINKLRRELNLETQASAVLVAAEAGIEVAALAQSALDELIESYGA